MIEVLLLSRTYGTARVRQAVEEALEMGTSSMSAIRYLLNVDCRQTSSHAAAVEIGELSRNAFNTVSFDNRTLPR